MKRIETQRHQQENFLLRLSATVFTLILLLNVNASAATSAPKSYKQLLSLLIVKPESSNIKFDRDKHFGNWRDDDRDCLDTRAEVLVRESLIPPIFEKCRATTGRWYSIFDGRTYLLATAVQIDHLVALREAWDSGASLWSKERRLSFANDLGYSGSLSVMTTKLNGNCKKCKSDKDPTLWLPQKQQCLYAQRWIAVKYRWGLSIDIAEKRALANLLTGSCGEMRANIKFP